MNRRLMASAMALLMAAACMTGCSKKNDVKVTVNSSGGSAVQKKELGPGKEFSGKLGENFKYEESNMDVRLVELGQTAPVDADGVRQYAFLFTAVNNSDKDIRIWMLDSIKVAIDGKEIPFESTFSAVSAANAAIKYGEYTRFDDTIKAGESFTGYIPFEIKGDWLNMRLEYKPDSENSNDYIVYDFTTEDVVMK